MAETQYWLVAYVAIYRTAATDVAEATVSTETLARYVYLPEPHDQVISPDLIARVIALLSPDPAVPVMLLAMTPLTEFPHLADELVL